MAEPELNKVRVLIISYHFPPLNVISAFRAEAFAKYLPAHDIEPTVLTLQWQETNDLDASTSGADHYVWHRRGAPVVYQEISGSRVIRLPRVRGWYQVLIDRAMRIPLLSKALGAIAYALGIFNIHILYSHISFKNFLKDHLQQEKYDVVIAMMSPDEHIALARWIKDRWGIPFIADYRDTYDNRILDTDFDPDLATRIKLWFKNNYHRHWMAKCDLLVSVSDILVQKLSQITGMNKTLEIRNGYDPEKILPAEGSIDRELFKITYAGRIYPHQDIQPFIQTIRRFDQLLPSEDRNRVLVQFFGVQDKGHANELEHQLKDITHTIRLTRIPSKSIYGHLAESSLLILFDIRTTGGYTGKFMDYVGCRRNILMIPSDNGVIADLMEKGRLGLATQDPESAAQFLLLKFNEWKAEGKPRFEGVEEVIQATSRKEQISRLAISIRTISMHGRRLTIDTGNA